MNRLLAIFLITTLAVPASAARYAIDTSHSSVGFKVRHMVISKTRGVFETFSGWVEYDPKKPKSWKVDVTIETASVNTQNEDRDNHLRNKDFFDVKKFPQMKFVSTRVEKVKGNAAVLVGKLTMKGVTKTVRLDIENHGIVKGPWGKTRTGWSATTKIDRTDYGVTWNKNLDQGGVVVGEEVEIAIEIEAIQEGKKKGGSKKK
jgi:polyisoprenoid-binding protein YceI